MKKDVMIFIKGTQEVDGEKDTIALATKGRYYKRRDVLYLSYEEMDEDDTEPTMKTLLKIEGDNRVTMTRSGKRNQQLIIEKGERHQCHYDNGYADWIMGIQGYGIENGLEDNGGTLNFKYSMDINAMFASENEVNIVVKECEENA